jgi:hypothetical protein
MQAISTIQAEHRSLAVAGDHSSVAVEQAVRKPVNMFGVVPGRGRRFHPSIVREDDDREKYDRWWSATTRSARLLNALAGTCDA